MYIWEYTHTYYVEAICLDLNVDMQSLAYMIHVCFTHLRMHMPTTWHTYPNNIYMQMYKSQMQKACACTQCFAPTDPKALRDIFITDVKAQNRMHVYDALYMHIHAHQQVGDEDQMMMAVRSKTMDKKANHARRRSAMWAACKELELEEVQVCFFFIPDKQVQLSSFLRVSPTSIHMCAHTWFPYFHHPYRCMRIPVCLGNARKVWGLMSSFMPEYNLFLFGEGWLDPRTSNLNSIWNSFKCIGMLMPRALVMKEEMKNGSALTSMPQAMACFAACSQRRRHLFVANHSHCTCCLMPDPFYKCVRTAQVLVSVGLSSQSSPVLEAARQNLLNSLSALRTDCAAGAGKTCRTQILWYPKGGHHSDVYKYLGNSRLVACQLVCEYLLNIYVFIWSRVYACAHVCVCVFMCIMYLYVSYWSCAYVFMCLCVYVCMYIYMHVYIYVYIYVCIYICMYIYIYIYIYIVRSTTRKHSTHILIRMCHVDGRDTWRLDGHHSPYTGSLWRCSRGDYYFDYFVFKLVFIDPPCYPDSWPRVSGGFPSLWRWF